MDFFDIVEGLFELGKAVGNASKSVSGGVSGHRPGYGSRGGSSSYTQTDYGRDNSYDMTSNPYSASQPIPTEAASPASRELKCASTKKVGLLDKPYPRIAISPAFVKFDAPTLFQWKISNKYKIDRLNISVDYIRVTDPAVDGFVGDFLVRHDYDGKHYSVLNPIATFNITLPSEVYSGSRDFTVPYNSHMHDNNTRGRFSWYISICGQREGRISFRHFYDFRVMV